MLKLDFLELQVKKNTTKLLGPDIARQMFHDIETIYTFHSDYLLPTLSDRLKKWWISTIISNEFLHIWWDQKWNNIFTIQIRVKMLPVLRHRAFCWYHPRMWAGNNFTWACLFGCVYVCVCVCVCVVCSDYNFWTAIAGNFIFGMLLYLDYI